MDQPIISIITVVYNAQNVLEQTILSVIQQTYKHIDFIIIDGGSTDQTVEIINKYDRNISYWKSEADYGIYDAMNKGVKVAKGNWIYFLGAGDILFNVIHKLIPYFKDFSTLYYGDVYKLDDLKLYDGRFSGWKLAVSNICHQAIFYPSAVFENLKYNLKYKTHADHDLNMRLYGDALVKFKYVPVIISLYEGNGLSATVIDDEFFKDKLSIIKSNFNRFIYVYAFTRKKIAAFIKILSLK